MNFTASKNGQASASHSVERNARTRVAETLMKSVKTGI